VIIVGVASALNGFRRRHRPSRNSGRTTSTSEIPVVSAQHPTAEIRLRKKLSLKTHGRSGTLPFRRGRPPGTPSPDDRTLPREEMSAPMLRGCFPQALTVTPVLAEGRFFTEVESEQPRGSLRDRIDRGRISLPRVGPLGRASLQAPTPSHRHDREARKARSRRTAKTASSSFPTRPSGNGIPTPMTTSSLHRRRVARSCRPSSRSATSCAAAAA
jgi:hypothetical protein